ncbi:MAG: type II secretion system F family protein [Bacillota bacterium]
MKAGLAAACTGLAIFVMVDGVFARKYRRWTALVGTRADSCGRLLEVLADLPYPAGCGDLPGRLRLAGRPCFTKAAWVRRRLGSLALGGSILLVLFLVCPALLPAPAAFCVAAMSYWWPDLWLARECRVRRRKVQTAFPGFLDLMATCANAGHSLYTSLLTVAPRVSGPLGEIFREVCQQLESGRRLWAALEYARGNAGLAEVDTFVTAMAEADALGAPIAETLRNLASLARTQRRYALEAAAATLPLKLSICTIVFFLPPVFVLLVVPNLMAFLISAW